MPWIVKIISLPKCNVFRSGFFPRTVYYKKDAKELVKEVEFQGGKAVIEKVKR